jgi:DNA-binding XRE family transcriptional regulator
MTPTEIREARRELGLTQGQLAALLDTDRQSVLRMELDPSASTFRRPAPRMVRLLRAYLDGYRPADWPECQIEKENDG